MSNDTQVLVAGAGPTGLLTACLLARSGISVRIVDKNDGPIQASRILALQPRSLELLQKLGLERPFLEAGALGQGVQVFAEGGRAALSDFDPLLPDTPYPFVLFLNQAQMETILLNDLRTRRVEVERQCEFASIEQNDAGVRVGLVRGGEVEVASCDYVVGADGSHSAVRKGLRLEFKGTSTPTSFLLADCRVEGPLDPAHIKVFLYQQRLAAQFPLAGGFSHLVIQVVDPHDRGQGSSGDVTLEAVQAAFREVTGTDCRLSDATSLSRYQIHHRGVDCYRVGRAFVAGDAAQIHSPVGGQGLNTGLQDAANLAWKLSVVLKHTAPDALLDTYHAERWPVGSKLLAHTHKIFAAVTQPQTGIKVNLMGRRTRSDLNSSRAFHYASQLGIRYHPNLAVSVPAGDTGLVKPGYRAPNAPLQRQVDVFGVLQGYGFDILALSRKPLTADEIKDITMHFHGVRKISRIPLKAHLVGYHLGGRTEAVVRTETPQLFSVYGVPDPDGQALLLIRPDGYVAFSAPSFDWAGLTAFVLRLCGENQEVS